MVEFSGIKGLLEKGLGPQWMVNPVMTPLAEMSGRSHWNVIRLGFTSMGSKLDREPGTPSLVVKKELMGVDLLGMLCSVPAIATTVNV